MQVQDFARRTYELHDVSRPQRWTLAGVTGVWVGVAWWLLFGVGLQTAGGWFGWTWTAGDPLRRFCLAAALSIYYIRILFTDFVFLKRGVSWSEVFTICPWLLGIYLVLAIAGGRNAESFGVVGSLGVVLFLVGSWMNSYAEYSRHVWKRRLENRGQLFTQGLFRYSRHPNYLGDLVLFSGLCFMTGAWVSAVIPAIMFAGFVFINIPALDAHLHDRYGVMFDEYAKHTRKLIPLVY